MKKALFILLLTLSYSSFSQKYFTRTGNTNFKASVAVFEPIEATNNSTSVLLNTETGALVAQLFMTAFQFRVALMQEHFNENYMDSYKYPKAIFKGELSNFNLLKVNEKEKHTLTGILTIRGITKEIKTTAFLKKENNTLFLKAKFIVSPKDFKIEIPAIVEKKIAENIEVSINYTLNEKE
jgi:polyisoprenoid-binding protein YceI